MTNTQRASWVSFAASHPITDALGQSIVLTGQQMFVKVSSVRLNIGGSISATVPAVLTLPDVSAATFEYSVATGATWDGYTGLIGQKITLALGAPVSPGVSFFKTFWQPLGADGIVLGNSAPQTLAPAIYTAQFGTVVVGQRIFSKLTPTSADGWPGTPIVLSTVSIA